MAPVSLVSHALLLLLLLLLVFSFRFRFFASCLTAFFFGPFAVGNAIADVAIRGEAVGCIRDEGNPGVVNVWSEPYTVS